MADDAACTSGFGATGFELRLHERYECATGAEDVDDAGEQLLDADERRVDDHDVHRVAEHLALVVTRVRTFEDVDAWIAA